MSDKDGSCFENGDIVDSVAVSDGTMDCDIIEWGDGQIRMYLGYDGITISREIAAKLAKVFVTIQETGRLV